MAFTQVNFGVKAGANFASIYTSGSFGASGLRVGTHLSASLDIASVKNFSVLTEASYNQLGGKHKSSDALKSDYKIDYFSLPVLFKYNSASGINIYAGPQISFSTNAKYQDVFVKTDITKELN